MNRLVPFSAWTPDVYPRRACAGTTHAPAKRDGEAKIISVYYSSIPLAPAVVTAKLSGGASVLAFAHRLLR